MLVLNVGPLENVNGPSFGVSHVKKKPLFEISSEYFGIRFFDSRTINSRGCKMLFGEFLKIESIGHCSNSKAKRSSFKAYGDPISMPPEQNFN